MKQSRFIFAVLVCLVLVSPAVAQERAYPVRPELGVRATMRDGVALVADIYRPRAEGKFPVLLQRTPYNRRGGQYLGNALAAHGYVVIFQDTRGRFDSGGEFYPFRHEAQDGYDSVEWAAALPYSNGQVGMFGGSYVGATQMLAATAKPPHLLAIYPYVTASEYYEGWTYQGGAWAQWFSESWTTGLALDTLQRKTGGRSSAKQWINILPPESYPVIQPATDVAPYFRDWIEHETDDAYWKPVKVSDHYPEMTVKGLHAGGWHDLFLKGSIQNYLGLHANAATEAARRDQRLLIGPWAHAATSPEGKIGDVTFGKQAVLDDVANTVKWFNYALKGEQNEYATGAPVRIFVMGENVWRSEQEFPPARAKMTRFYLHSGGKANSAAGDGSLSTQAPREETADTFEYDPANPVPTIGGRLCCGEGIPPGPFDQRPNDSRQDALVFTTAPFENPTEVTGFLTLELWAATSAVDTDWTAVLANVAPDGYARFLTDGVIRARYRNSTAHAELLEPGRIYPYKIDLWATSNLFLAGHRLRVYVSSSNFPRFNRNLNTGEPILGSSRMIRAKQTIYHDAEHPSALVLPVVPR